MARVFVCVVVLWCVIGTPSQAQQIARAYGGAVAGISTLSADARSEVMSGRANISLYKPENGPALNLVFGLHLHDYVTVQANYVWNDNDVALTSVSTADSSFYEQPRTSSQHAGVVDLLLYFRDRRSVVRPYLSVGGGIVRLNTRPNGQPRATNAASPPPAHLHATNALLRVAVGIDIALGGGWRARYSFSESVSDNPFSKQLMPPGQRNLANFQNLFGVVRTF